MQKLTFLKQLIKEPQQVAAIAPSGRFLADRVTECAKVRDAGVVVEFGPGDGAITEVLVPKLRAEAVFFAIEINEEFVATLNERFPDVLVYHDSAANTRKYLEELGHDGCDSIVSGLPWAAFPDTLQDELLDAVHDVLRPGGYFATYMYVQSPLLPAGSKFRKKLLQRFGHMDASPIVWRNLPPATVLSVQKR